MTIREAIGWVALTAFVVGCCDRETRRLQPHWVSAMEPYELIQTGLSSADHNGAAHLVPLVPIPESRERCFDDMGITACIRDQRYGFWLDLTNKRDKPIRLLWPEARYVDELRKRHEVYAPERGDLTVDVRQVHLSPVDTLRPGERRRPTVMPIYKQYMVGCRDPELFSEPLVPTRLDDKDEIATKYYVKDLAKRQVPVKLVLPIEIDGTRYDYVFTFVLRDRWAELPKK